MDNIKTVDIWSWLYSVCLDGNIEECGKIENRTVFRDHLRRHYYFLTDSRYGNDYFL